MVSQPELAAPRNKWKATPTHFGQERRVRQGGKADAAFGLRLLMSQHQPQKDTSKEGLFDHEVVLIPYESILRSMCPSENTLEVRASGVRSESFALGKRFAVFKLSASLSPRAKLRPRMLVTSGRLFFHPRSKQHWQRSLDFSRPSRLGSKLIVAYLTPFLIIRKIGGPFPLSLRIRKASLTVDRLQQGEPSLFGSSSA